MSNHEIIKIDNPFDEYEPYLEPLRVRQIISAEIDNFIFTRNLNTSSNYPDKYENMSPEYLNSERSGLCSQLSMLALCMLGPTFFRVQHRNLFLDCQNKQVSHTILKNDKGQYLDFSIRQFEGFLMSNISYDDFKPVWMNYVYGFDEVRIRGVKSQKLGLIFPGSQIRKNFTMLADKYPELFFLKWYLEMYEEVKDYENNTIL